MKIIFSYVFCIFLILSFLSSCSQQPTHNPNYTSTSGGAENSGGILVDRHQLSIRSLDGLHAYIQKYTPPYPFISPDKLSCFGTFNYIVFLNSPTITETETYTNNYDWYMYNFLDSSDRELFLYVAAPKHHSDPVDPSRYLTATEVDLNNMRFLQSEKSGFYIHSGVQYYFKHGKLLSILWMNGDLEFTLTDYCLGTYPEDGNPFILQLLNTETARAALDSLNLNPPNG